MRTPDSQWQQFEGKAHAELLRGSGRWQYQPHACDLEPPFEPFDRQTLTYWDCIVNNWENDWERSYRRFKPNQPIVLPHVEQFFDDLAFISVEPFVEDEATIDKAVQLLLSLPHPQRPVAFEVIGLGHSPRYDDHELFAQIAHENAEGDFTRHLFDDAITGFNEPFTTVQFVAHQADVDTLTHQLVAHYPRSAIRRLDRYTEAISEVPAAVVLRENCSRHRQPGRYASGGTLALDAACCFPLQTFARLDTDPLGPAITAMEHLTHWQWAVLQVLFTPASYDWEYNLRQAVRHPYKPSEPLFSDLTEHDVSRKFTSPLFAVSVRLMADQASVYERLLGWAAQFASPPQALSSVDDLTDEELLLVWDAMQHRYPLAPGVLLNTEELASLVHLPGPTVTSERLRRVSTRTKAGPSYKAEPGSVTLGENVHRGQVSVAGIPPDLRGRHCYIAGASGTGKSTLLLNMITQDIAAGNGVGVIDPHGDLIEAVLARVPVERFHHVAYFNPTDPDFPPALNILQAHGSAERQRVVSETVTTIHKFFPDAWGPRLQHILLHALDTMVRFRGATLWHLRRLLTNEQFRERHVDKLDDANLIAFWHSEFPGLPKGAVDPILNKLSPFLLNTTIRNIVCQPKTTFNFRTIMDERQILLANLSAGLLTPQVAGVLGTFIMGKIVAAAFGRAAIPERERVPFYLYIDEFQNFMDLSVGFEQILSEARKYKLILAGMANQYVGQLSDAVRQAIFGNVGTLLTFRLGVEDANRIAREFGEFTAHELMALERGQAICRLGGLHNSFNVTTPAPPPEQPANVRGRIVEFNRYRYATPRSDVEKQFTRRTDQPTSATSPPRSARATSSAKEQAQAAASQPDPAQSSPPPGEFTPDDLDDFTV